MRAYNFAYPLGREAVQIVVWNGGQPFLLDGRNDIPVVWSIAGWVEKKDVLSWAAKKQFRCVGFEGDTRLPRRSTDSLQTWAVVG